MLIVMSSRPLLYLKKKVVYDAGIAKDAVL
jgi:hypothetical protein